MAPRRRNWENRGLPDNLYPVRRSDGRIYYQYKRPDTGQFVGFGYDQAKAVDAAKQLNQLLGKGRGLVSRVLDTSDESFGEFLRRFRDTIQPARRIKGKPLSNETLKEHHRLVRHFDKEWGHKTFRLISQADLANYLNRQRTSEVFNKHRALLSTIWKHAVSEGLASENLPARILPRDKELVRRRRLPLQGYAVIYSHASHPIKNAMDLAIRTLQRRRDIQKMRFDDCEGGFLYVIQTKTEKHGDAAHIKIEVDSGLESVFGRCRDNIVSPFLVHQRPKRIKRSKEKQHWTQLSRKEISDGFARARDLSDYFTNLAPPERPTFHEIRSLGAELYRAAGWPEREIQKLLGHTTLRQTSEYLSRHERRWTLIAGLPIFKHELNRY